MQIDSSASAKESIPKDYFIAPESVVIARGEILKNEFELFRSAALKYLHQKKSDGDDAKEEEGIKDMILLAVNLIDIDFLILSLSKTEFSNAEEQKESEEFLKYAEVIYKDLLGVIYPPLKPTFLPLAGKLLNMGFQLGVRRKTWTGLCRKSEALPVFGGTE